MHLNDMANTSNIRFRCPKKLRQRTERILKIKFSGNGNSHERKLSELGREAMFDYVARKEKEYGLAPAAGQIPPGKAVMP